MNPLNDRERGVYSGLLRARRMALEQCEKCPHKPVLVGCLARAGGTCAQYQTVEAINREVFKMMESLPVVDNKQMGAA